MSSRVLVIEKLEGLVMVRLGNVEICMYNLTDPNKSDIYPNQIFIIYLRSKFWMLLFFTETLEFQGVPKNIVLIF